MINLYKKISSYVCTKPRLSSKEIDKKPIKYNGIDSKMISTKYIFQNILYSFKSCRQIYNQRLERFEVSLDR